MYVDENATRMAPFTMATQFNVSMASSEEESEGGEEEGKWDMLGRPTSMQFSPASSGAEKHLKRGILAGHESEGEKSSSSRHERRHSVPKSLLCKDDENIKPEQTGKIR